MFIHEMVILYNTTFLGDWYEVGRTDNPRQSGDCSRVNFAAADDGVISVRNEVVNRNFYEETTGTLSQEGETSRLTLNLNGFSEPVDFWVLNTNYNNFTLTYKCINISPTQRARGDDAVPHRTPHVGDPTISTATGMSRAVLLATSPSTSLGMRRNVRVHVVHVVLQQRAQAARTAQRHQYGHGLIYRPWAS
ncbi:hypothetical protein MSG28_006759 [Choristoneura fumiferana]|uniref:Uncharacterized protein n=1 Tax=Choristoneura fumiferana TaxID=7141 RepID=A0ACC0JLC0_CHOFU|nr:hypothetical protein MSG28_006759 [Choristoneura fumiferana]